ncbi:MAG: P-loop NTPase [Candidatus Micrarchaeota archaeon]|nr:P-loop NTPase [Candidatus Micrarchaeota archaeon]
MGRIIAVASGKGGVGKTTLVSNLSAALARYGQNVIAVDGNLTTSNLGLHLGVSLYPVTIHDILEGVADVNDALLYHEHGFRIIPADISIREVKRSRNKAVESMLYKLSGIADFVLIDTAAGLGKETVQFLRAADEVLTVTNPNLPAVTDALKLNTLATKHETTPIGVVLNRIMNHPSEMASEEVEDFLGIPVIGKVPEDKAVHKSIAAKTPVVVHSPKSLAAQHFRAIAAQLIGEEYTPRRSLTHTLFGWLK